MGLPPQIAGSGEEFVGGIGVAAGELPAVHHAGPGDPQLPEQGDDGPPDPGIHPASSAPAVGVAETDRVADAVRKIPLEKADHVLRRLPDVHGVPRGKVNGVRIAEGRHAPERAGIPVPGTFEGDFFLFPGKGRQFQHVESRGGEGEGAPRGGDPHPRRGGFDEKSCGSSLLHELRGGDEFEVVAAVFQKFQLLEDEAHGGGVVVFELERDRMFPRGEGPAGDLEIGTADDGRVHFAVEDGCAVDLALEFDPLPAGDVGRRVAEFPFPVLLALEGGEDALFLSPGDEFRGAEEQRPFALAREDVDHAACRVGGHGETLFENCPRGGARGRRQAVEFVGGIEDVVRMAAGPDPADLQFRSGPAAGGGGEIFALDGELKGVFRSGEQGPPLEFYPRFPVVGFVPAVEAERESLAPGVAGVQRVVDALGDAVRAPRLAPPFPEVIRLPGEAEHARHGELPRGDIEIEAERAAGGNVNAPVARGAVKKNGPFEIAHRQSSFVLSFR